MPAKDVENGTMVVREPQSKNNSKPLVNTTITVECNLLYSGGGDITCGKDEQWFPRRTCSLSELCTVILYCMMCGFRKAHCPVSFSGNPLVRAVYYTTDSDLPLPHRTPTPTHTD